MVKTKGIHHLVLTVKNLKKAKEFYEKVCGMEVFTEGEGFVGLSDGTLDSLWLSTARDYVPKNQKFDRNQIGLDHWAFWVDSIEDLKTIEKHLHTLGIEMEDGGITDDGFGGSAIFTKDPDGMKVEFHLVSPTP